MMQPRNSRIALLVLLVLATAAWADLGAALRPVDENEAQRISGIARPGLVVESVTDGSIAALLGLAAQDIVVELNATRALQPEDVERAVRAADEGNSVVYLRAGRSHTTTVSPPRGTKVAFILEPLAIDDPDSPWHSIAAASGLEVEMRSELPQDFSEYVALVLQHPEAVHPDTGEELGKYVSKGGGVGLIGQMLAALAGNDDDMSRIAQWLGLMNMGSMRLGPDQVRLQANKPWGTEISAGQQLYQTLGNTEPYVALPRNHGPRLAVVADWRADRGVQGPWSYSGPFTAMFYNRYGDGRVFWSGLPVDAPDYPLLKELHTAAIRWLAGVQGPQ